jgi:hypothetical protein
MQRHLLKVRVDWRGAEYEGVWFLKIEIEERVLTEQREVLAHAVPLLDTNLKKTEQERDTIARWGNEIGSRC